MNSFPAFLPVFFITGLVTNYTTPGNSFSYTYTYDAFDRLAPKLGTRHSIQYTYVAGTQRVSTYSISQADSSYVTYSYIYDALGNITQIKKNGTTVSVYEYDSLGRLIRENDCANSTAWVYTYDNAGNLLKKYTFYGLSDSVPASHLLTLHPYNGSEISSTYTYSSSAWGDLLTGYNGITIEYTDNENPNTIGNPLNWRNATNMKWHQRSLTSMSIGGTAVYYTYNADGIRTQKTVGAGGHVYVLDGSTILKETIYTAGNLVNTLYYYYDESGISGLEYNGAKYTYVKNLQGDVIGIINSNGATVVEYKYDAWGNILATTGSMASTLGVTNPFRYRGYYYDTESGWYYLNSRYYDPQVGRFLNADGIIGANGGIMGYNMFAYCSNNPVVYFDPSGCEGQTLYEPYDFGYDTLECWILQLWQFYKWEATSYCFTLGERHPIYGYISEKRFIQAMHNVNFQASPPCIDLYNEITGSNIPYNAYLIGTISISTTLHLGFITFETSHVGDRNGDTDLQFTFGGSTDCSVGVSVQITFSNAPDTSSMKGTTITYGSSCWVAPFISVTSSSGIMPSGYTTYSVGVFVGLSFEKWSYDSPGVTYTY